MEADFRVLQTHYGGRHDTEGYASLHPRLRATRFARAFDLSGRATLGILHRFYGFFLWWCEVKRVIISLSEASLRLIGITLAVMRLLGGDAAAIRQIFAVNRHHLGGDAVIGM